MVFARLLESTVFGEKWVDFKSVKSFGKFVSSTFRIFEKIFGGSRFYPLARRECNNIFRIAKISVAQNWIFKHRWFFGVMKIRSKIESSYIGEQNVVGDLASELLFCCCSYFATIYSIFAILRLHLARTSQGVCGAGGYRNYARSRVQDRTWAGKKTRVESGLSYWHTVQQFNPLRVLLF